MLSKTKIYIVDFEDSFTFNIASSLFSYEEQLLVIPHDIFFSRTFFNTLFLDNQYNKAIILGPGPGNPIEYSNYFVQINEIKKNNHLYLMGICLGHQIISLTEGLIVKNSLFPMHGQQVAIFLNGNRLLVQKYNSLAVFKSYLSIDEINILIFNRGISYQFHPESIGTKNNAFFFKELLLFIGSTVI